MAVEGTARAAEGDSTRPRDNSGSSGGSSNNHRRRLATLTVAVVCVLARIVAAAAPAASAGAAAAAPLRAGLCGGAFEALAARPELASPLTSALRIAEGAELARLGHNPYAGGACRAHPIVLQALTPLVLPPPGAAPSAARRLRTAAPFVIADVLAAAALAYAAGAVRAAYRCAEATARARGGEVERRRQPRHRKGSASSSSSGTISSSNASPSAKVPVPTRAPEAAEERDGQREERGDPRQQRHREEPHAVSRAAQQLDMAAVRERASLVARLPGAPPPDVVALLYLANPLTFAACVGLSAGAFENAALLGALGAACALRTSVAGALAALAAAVGVQPVLAAPALALLAAVGPWGHGEDERVAESGAAARASGSAQPATAATLRRGMLSFVLWFALASAALAGAARALMADAPGGALPAARAIAGHALLGEELEPNLGMWWYFNVEVFDHSRSFFLVVFHAQPLLVLAPLLIRLRKRPLVAAFACITLMGAYRPHPTASDVALPLALLPLLASRLANFRFGSTLCLAYGLAVLGVPLTWRAWRVMGIANSNLYYAATLAAGGAQGLMLIEVLRACHTHERLAKRAHP